MKGRTGADSLQSQLNNISYEIKQIETEYNQYLNVLLGCINLMPANLKGVYALSLGKVKLKSTTPEADDKWQHFQQQTFEVYDQLESLYQSTHDTQIMRDELRNKIHLWKQDQENLANKKNLSELDKAKIEAINELVSSLENYLAVYDWKAVLEKRSNEFKDELKQVEDSLQKIVKFEAQHLQLKKLLSAEKHEDVTVLLTKNYKITDADLNAQRVVEMHKKLTKLKSDIEQHNDASKSINIPPLPAEMSVMKAGDNAQLAELKTLVEAGDKQLARLNAYIDQLEGMMASLAKHDKRAEELASQKRLYQAEKKKIMDEMHHDLPNLVDKKRSALYDKHFAELESLKVNGQELKLPVLAFPDVFEGALTTVEEASVKVSADLERHVQKINDTLKQHQDKSKKLVRDLKKEYEKTHKNLLNSVQKNVDVHRRRALESYSGSYDPETLDIDKLVDIQRRGEDLQQKLRIAKEKSATLAENHQSNANLKSVKDNILHNQNNQKVKNSIARIMQAKKIKNPEALFHFDNMNKLDAKLQKQLQRAFRNELNQALIIMQLSDVGAEVPDKVFLQQYKMVKRRFDELASIAILYADYENHLHKAKDKLAANKINTWDKKYKLAAEVMSKIKQTGHPRAGTLMTYLSGDVLNELAVLHADKKSLDIAVKHTDARGEKTFKTCHHHLSLFAPPIITGQLPRHNGKHADKMTRTKPAMRKSAKKSKKLSSINEIKVRATHRRSRASHS